LFGTAGGKFPAGFVGVCHETEESDLKPVGGGDWGLPALCESTIGRIDLLRTETAVAQAD